MTRQHQRYYPKEQTQTFWVKMTAVLPSSFLNDTLQLMLLWDMVSEAKLTN